MQGRLDQLRVKVQKGFDVTVIFLKNRSALQKSDRFPGSCRNHGNHFDGFLTVRRLILRRELMFAHQ